MDMLDVKKVAKWWKAGHWNVAMLDKAVEKGKLSKEDADKIKDLPVKG